MKKLNNKGQGLIEAMVALGSAVFIISLIAIVVITSVNNADFSKNQNLATQYAQQGLDTLRQQSKSNWTTFSSFSGTYCLSKDPSTLEEKSGTCSTTGLIIDKTFVREIQITQPSPPGNCSGTGYRLINVSVSWANGKCTDADNPYCHSVKLDTCITDINSVSAP